MENADWFPGLNAVCTPVAYRARIGSVANNENASGSCNSRNEFCTAGYADNTNTCANVAMVSADNGHKLIKTMCRSWLLLKKNIVDYCILPVIALPNPLIFISGKNCGTIRLRDLLN